MAVSFPCRHNLPGTFGCGSTLKSQGYAVFCLWFHLPRCHFDTFLEAAAILARSSTIGIRISWKPSFLL